MSKPSAMNVLLTACLFPNRFESCLLLSCLKNLSIEYPDIWLNIVNKRDTVHNNNSNSNKSSTIISARKSMNDRENNIINNIQTQNSGTHAFSWENFISQIRSCSSARLLASSPEESVTKVSNNNAVCHSERDAHQGGPCSDRGLYNHEVPIVRVLSGGMSNRQWVINDEFVLRVNTKQNNIIPATESVHTVQKLSASSNFSISSAASSSSSSSACSVENPAINGPQGSFTVERAVLTSLSSLSCAVCAEGCCRVLNSCAICESGLLFASFLSVDCL